MPATKEARGFFYTLLIIGTLVIIASLYSTVWASPSQGVNGDTAPTVPTLPATATAEAAATATAAAEATATRVAIAAATSAASAATAEAQAIASAASAEATATASPPVEIAVSTDGAVTAFSPGSVSSLSSPDNVVTISIPSSAPKGSFNLVYEPKAVADAPSPAPEGLSFASTVFELSVLDLTGQEATDTSFRRPIKITVQYTDADVLAAGGNPGRLVIYKYDELLSAWTPLTTIFDPVAKTVTAQVSRLSFFALMGGEPLPTPTPTPVPPGEAAPTATLVPPAPGDVAPSSGLLLGMLIAAFILIGAGSYYMRQRNQT